MTNEETKIQEIEHRINARIDCAARDFETYGRNDFNESQKFRIYGMIETLQILTGKEYYFDANGLHERKV